MWRKTDVGATFNWPVKRLAVSLTSGSPKARVVHNPGEVPRRAIFPAVPISLPSTDRPPPVSPPPARTPTRARRRRRNRQWRRCCCRKVSDAAECLPAAARGRSKCCPVRDERSLVGWMRRWDEARRGHDGDGENGELWGRFINALVRMRRTDNGRSKCFHSDCGENDTEQHAVCAVLPAAARNFLAHVTVWRHCRVKAYGGLEEELIHLRAQSLTDSPRCYKQLRGDCGHWHQQPRNPPPHSMHTSRTKICRYNVK